MSGDKLDPEETDMLPEYDFRDGVRGKYVERYTGGTNLVLLEADVAEASLIQSPSIRRSVRSCRLPDE